MLLILGILAFVWPRGTFGGDNFYGQQLVVFGTSLSDNGNGIDPYISQTLGLAGKNLNWPIAPPYYLSPVYGGAMFSSGPTWPDYLGKMLNVPVLDYAIGASAIAPYPWSSLANSYLFINCSNFPPLLAAPNGLQHVIPVPTLFDQVNQYIVGGVYPSSKFLNSSRQRHPNSNIPHDNVYIIEFGGNDLLKFRDAVFPLFKTGINATYVFDLLRSGQIQDFTKPLVEGVRQAMLRLYKAGARRFVLWHMAPAGLTPVVQNLLASYQKQNPNSGVQVALAFKALDLLLECIDKGFDNIGNNFPSDHPGSAVAIFDTGAAYREILENKAAYGIKITNQACLGGDYLCKPTPSALCHNPQEYFFFDGVHPTTVAHEALAHKLYNGVRALLLQGQASAG
eukprot:jgi/Botrbrau1/14579/Bobra.0312s0005.1